MQKKEIVKTVKLSTIFLKKNDQKPYKTVMNIAKKKCANGPPKAKYYINTHFFFNQKQRELMHIFDQSNINHTQPLVARLNFFYLCARPG